MDPNKLEYKSNNPLVAVIKEKNVYKVMNGNQVVSTLIPDFIEFDNSLDSVSIVIDGKVQKVKIGSLVTVKNDFSVEPIRGYRINVIGYSKHGVENESGLKIMQKEIMSNYAIDKQESTYMVQFYKDKKFCGIVTVKFEDAAKSKK